MCIFSYCTLLKPWLLLLFSRLTMEQTDATAARSSLTLDIDRLMDHRKSQISMLSGTQTEANFNINEVSYCCD